MKINIPASHPSFEGHFPGHPIMPGAMLLQLALSILKNNLNYKSQIIDIKRLKFHQFVQPDTTLQLEYRNNDSEGSEQNNERDNEQAASNEFVFALKEQSGALVLNGIVTIKRQYQSI